MMRALILAAVLASSSAAAFTMPNVYATATACKVKGDDMGRKSDRADAWQWFCMEQNHFAFSGCTYSPAAIYKPECWERRPTLDWPSAENAK